MAHMYVVCQPSLSGVRKSHETPLRGGEARLLSLTTMPSSPFAIGCAFGITSITVWWMVTFSSPSFVGTAFFAEFFILDFFTDKYIAEVANVNANAIFFRLRGQ